MLLEDAKESKSNDVPKASNYCSSESAANFADANYYPATGSDSKERFPYLAIIRQAGCERYGFKIKQGADERTSAALAGVSVEFSASAVNGRKDSFPACGGMLVTNVPMNNWRKVFSRRTASTSLSGPSGIQS